jgi:hypothetical protein
MFKRGAFDLGAVVCPIAIKYNKIFVDAFWNSKRQSFTAHLVPAAPFSSCSGLLPQLPMSPALHGTELLVQVSAHAYVVHQHELCGKSRRKAMAEACCLLAAPGACSEVGSRGWSCSVASHLHARAGEADDQLGGRLRRVLPGAAGARAGPAQTLGSWLF